MVTQFENEKISEGHKKWAECIHRHTDLYIRSGERRDEFKRDYDRILHCKAYRRLKHKTQVFFATENDHICTRIEHVNHVASISDTIATNLGLNKNLTLAIALGHDLGHTPFGHEGEIILSKLANVEVQLNFWHEKNSLHFVDDIETLPDPEWNNLNLNLTYAVRDGIITHCGEVDESMLRPRDDNIDLTSIEQPNQYQPYTWEACVVKIADKIAYLGRDIEDAILLGVLSPYKLIKLKHLINEYTKSSFRIKEINNANLISSFTENLCSHSSPANGIGFSSDYLQLINKVKDFNYTEIYKHPRLQYYREYAKLIINSLYQQLKTYCDAQYTIVNLEKDKNLYPLLTKYYKQWLVKYSDIDEELRNNRKYGNRIIYDVRSATSIKKSIMDFISGMTDAFATKLFFELIRFL